MTTTTHAMTRGMVLLFAFCCGAIVANIYYAQPIIGLIAPDHWPFRRPWPVSSSR
jgi:hypothetical protein